MRQLIKLFRTAAMIKKIWQLLYDCSKEPYLGSYYNSLDSFVVQVHTGCFIVKLHEQNRNRIFSHEIMAEGKNYEKEYYRHLGIDMGMYIHMVLSVLKWTILNLFFSISNEHVWKSVYIFPKTPQKSILFITVRLNELELPFQSSRSQL